MKRHSEEILNRIRLVLAPWKSNIEEKRMFGGYCFLYKGKMCLGEFRGQLMVRIPEEKMADFIEDQFIKAMDFTGKLMKGFILVSEVGFDNEKKLREWAKIGVSQANVKLKASLRKG